MKVLVVGSGGREHAIVWKLLESRSVEKVFCLPGNAGMQGPRTERLPLNVKDPGVLRWVEANRPGLVVIGPEEPLAMGLADAFRQAGVAVFGPGAAAAKLEASKAFAKSFMDRHGLPTAPWASFGDAAQARAWIAERPYGQPLVVKADGLAAGKGVRVAANREEALEAVADLMEKRLQGPAGATVVIEERLEGEEASVMALCDGATLAPLPVSRDHKRVFDGDQGPNTGGMGAFAPLELPEGVTRAIREEVLDRFLEGLRRDNLDYRGAVYFGLMLTSSGPKVLEFNVRFGDPETQAVLPLLESDFAELLLRTAEGRLSEAEVRVARKSAVCVVLASEGYPGPTKTGRLILGLDEPAALVFHAGTDRVRGRWVTGGGRVAGVTGLGRTLQEARTAAYDAARRIQFEGRHFRSDIAAPKTTAEIETEVTR